eukprot:scaffold521907_cov15-Prasinocladus_malaysianus.AAC.1
MRSGASGGRGSEHWIRLSWYRFNEVMVNIYMNKRRVRRSDMAMIQYVLFSESIDVAERPV